MADDDHACPGLVQACEALSKALTEQDRLRAALATAMRERDNFRAAWAGAEAALATALADRDAHVRGYEDMEQRHAAVVAERDQAQRERDEARAQLHGCRAQLKEWDQDIGKVQAECDALKAEVERLRNENQTAWNKASVLDEGLRHLRAAIASTEENVRAYYRAQGQHGEARGQDVRDILAAIAARAEVARVLSGAHRVALSESRSSKDPRFMSHIRAKGYSLNRLAKEVNMSPAALSQARRQATDEYFRRMPPDKAAQIAALTGWPADDWPGGAHSPGTP